jgi:UDP-N-acetylmuramate--alanine ligase
MNTDISTIKKIFFIGIGGIGISALAKFAKAQGKEVAGLNDEASGTTIDALKAEGISVVFLDGFSLPEADMYVYSDAWLYRGPEILEAAKATGKPVLSYFGALGLFAAKYKVIAIAGVHGKTTTTAMTGEVLMHADFDPTIVVGSFVKKFGSNFHLGKSEWLVVEADEYMRHFLQFKPFITVITNIEADHLDYYKDLADVQDAFKTLIAQTRDDGFIICDPNAPNMKEVLDDAKATIVDYRALVETLPKLSVPGEHNRLDAAAAKAVANVLSIPQEKSDEALKTFEGTWRRLEKRGMTANGTLVYDDYAHHPTEARASLSALRELYPRGEKTITVLFQPHLYSRTKALFNDFITAFDDADNVLFLPIYFAREDPDPEVSSEKLADAVRVSRGEAMAFSSFQEAEAHLTKMNLGPKDVLVTMGAGEAYKIGDSLLK